jgi:DNA-binding response OmpR family regulator
MTSSAKQIAHILIVDDQVEFVELLETGLTLAGYQASTITTSQEVLAAIRDRQPAALVLDVRMPTRDGFALLRELRMTPYGLTLPVILMSGAWRTHEQGWSIGLSDQIAPTKVLPKPFRLDDLVKNLRRLGVPPGEV